MHFMLRSNNNGVRIIFYIDALSGNGAERVWTVLAAGLALRGHEVIFLVERGDDENRGYLDKSVKLQTLCARSHIAQLAEIATLSRSFCADIIVTAGSNANVEAALVRLLFRPTLRLIMSLHSVPEAVEGLLGKAGYFLLPLIGRLADRVVYNSHGLRNELEGRYFVPRTRGMVIYNPV